jgi:hypothetical protein
MPPDFEVDKSGRTHPSGSIISLELSFEMIISVRTT